MTKRPDPAPEPTAASTPEPLSTEGDPIEVEGLDGEGLDAEAFLDRDSAEAGDALTEAEAMAAEHLADLQRLQAEYVNYRKRVERDRAAVIDLAVARVVEALLPVLDDITAARSHGELDGPFAAIAEKLEATLERMGLTSHGLEGEAFDPTVHEALASVPEAGLAAPTIREVAQAGYRLGDRVLRPTRVVVAQPE